VDSQAHLRLLVGDLASQISLSLQFFPLYRQPLLLRPKKNHEAVHNPACDHRPFYAFSARDFVWKYRIELGKF